MLRTKQSDLYHTHFSSHLLPLENLLVLQDSHPSNLIHFISSLDVVIGWYVVFLYWMEYCLLLTFTYILFLYAMFPFSITKLCIVAIPTKFAIKQSSENIYHSKISVRPVFI